MTSRRKWDKHPQFWSKQTFLRENTESNDNTREIMLK